MLPFTDLERVSLLFDIGEVHRAQYGRLKRVIDLVLATIGLVALAVAIPFVLVGDLVANRGSLFYRQPRVGKNGKVFRILKFRTMRPTTARSSTNGPPRTIHASRRSVVCSG